MLENPEKSWLHNPTTSYWNLTWKSSKSNMLLLSKMIFLPVKSHMHIFNILITSVQSFKLIASKLWEEFTQTCYPILKPNLKIVQNAIILSKMIFLPAKSHMHTQYAYNICAKFQIDCFKTLGGVDYTYYPILMPNLKIV